jgi:pseudouridine-5'-monophosphatase
MASDTAPGSGLEPVTHVIFDLDGLLIDTERCYTVATNTVANRYGKSFEWEHKVQVMGLPPKESNRRVIEVLGLPLSLEEFAAQIEKAFAEAILGVQLMPGAERLVKHLHSNGIPMAIATGSSRETFARKIKHLGDFFDIGKYFTHVVTSCDPDVKKGKPAPDTFLVCAQRFEANGNPNPVKMSHVLVFEDAPAGVAAALAGGMRVVMVPDPRVDPEEKAKATLAIETLHHLEPHTFGLPAF